MFTLLCLLLLKVGNGEPPTTWESDFGYNRKITNQNGDEPSRKYGRVVYRSEGDKANRMYVRSEVDRAKQETGPWRSEADAGKEAARGWRSEADAGKEAARYYRSEADAGKEAARYYRSEADAGKEAARYYRSEADAGKDAARGDDDLVVFDRDLEGKRRLHHIPGWDRSLSMRHEWGFRSAVDDPEGKKRSTSRYWMDPNQMSERDAIDWIRRDMSDGASSPSVTKRINWFSLAIVLAVVGLIAGAFRVGYAVGMKAPTQGAQPLLTDNTVIAVK